MDLLIKVWPLLAAAAPGLVAVLVMLWRVSAAVQSVGDKLDRHNEAIVEIKLDVKDLQKSARDHSSAIAALEAVQ